MIVNIMVRASKLIMGILRTLQSDSFIILDDDDTSVDPSAYRLKDVSSLKYI